MSDRDLPLCFFVGDFEVVKGSRALSAIQQGVYWMDAEAVHEDFSGMN